MTILVTGGAGFIGANFVVNWIRSQGTPVVNLDKLTYAGCLANLSDLRGNLRHTFVQEDICNFEGVAGLLRQHRPRAIVHLAAETHVDRSIESPELFVKTNVTGTFCLLETANEYWKSLPPHERAMFRFLHVSTDEVYGPLTDDAAPVTESAAYAPSSPYAASKAAADHLVHAFHRTYGLPTLIAHCCNNYGPYQYPEKLIPRMVTSALRGEMLPIYGDGEQIRSWLHVDDNCAALRCILEAGRVGEAYNITGACELSNSTVVGRICSVLDQMQPRPAGSYQKLVQHVADRPGHDRRYSMDGGKLSSLSGWKPSVPFDVGLGRTIAWYLERNQADGNR